MFKSSDYCMKKKSFRTIFFTAVLASVLASGVAAQKSFRLNDASKNVDVGIEVGVPPTEFGHPSAIYSFYRKGAAKPFQKMSVEQIDMWDEVPKANVTKRYDEQSVVNFGDFNFDGTEDVAINDGSKGGYGSPTYRVYLYSNTKRKYLYSEAFTEINNNGMNLGFMEIDRKKRMLYRFSKSGCCWHQTEGFLVMNRKPKKVYELTEFVPGNEAKTVEITTRRLINGKWREWTKHVNERDYYQ